MAIYEVPMPNVVREDLMRRGKNPDDFGCMAFDSSKQEEHDRTVVPMKKDVTTAQGE
ncbi:MAG: hypothetical protein ABIH23_13675 [bacterium]